MFLTFSWCVVHILMCWSNSWCVWPAVDPSLSVSEVLLIHLWMCLKFCWSISWCVWPSLGVFNQLLMCLNFLWCVWPILDVLTFCWFIGPIYDVFDQLLMWLSFSCVWSNSWCVWPSVDAVFPLVSLSTFLYFPPPPHIHGLFLGRNTSLVFSLILSPLPPL